MPFLTGGSFFCLKSRRIVRDFGGNRGSVNFPTRKHNTQKNVKYYTPDADNYLSELYLSVKSSVRQPRFKKNKSSDLF